MSIQEREETTTKVEVTKRDVLHRAADLIEEFGWCQHSYGSKAEGAFCLLGAVDEASIELTGVVPRLYSPTTNALYGEEEKYGTASIVDWNDKSGRTKQEVVKRLRELAEKAS